LLPDSIQNAIVGEYEGGLEIFCGEDSLYMESVGLEISGKEDLYLLALNSKVKLSVGFMELKILSFEDHELENDVIHIDVIENQYYQAKDVGSYTNVIYINDELYNEAEGPCAEIRLSLICLKNNNIGNIFVRGKKSI